MQVSNKSIRSVLDQINSNGMILPALQREFVWKRRDIEGLFDSLLQGFPINTLMFWNVKDIKQETMAFYRFLEPDYHESNSVNKLYPVIQNEPKTVVIDGQQRLTSLYIAVYGSFTLEKGKNKMYLYLNLDAPLASGSGEEVLSNTENYYNFKFMAKELADKLNGDGQHWICVKEAYPSDFNPVSYILNNKLDTNKFALEAVNKLSSLFQSNDVLNAYEISDDKDLQHVLNVFVRTNSGGKPLTKGDLLLSVITVNWANQHQTNARDYVLEIVSKVAKYGYKVDKDWVLGCILYLLDREVKLSVANFDIKTAGEIEQNKDAISESITSACILLNRYGMLERGLTTKLALYPIVYHIYKHLGGKVQSYHNGKPIPVESGIYVQMRTWLFRAIVKNLFEAGTAETLKSIQAVQRDKGSAGYFPLDEILIALKGKLDVTDQDIKTLLATEKRRAFPVLNIIYSTTKDRAYLSAKVDYDIDHIHAKTLFGNSPVDNRFDLIPNLQLLAFDENRSKNDRGLDAWWGAKNEGEKENYLLPKHLDASLQAFAQFVEAREKWFGGILAEKLSVSDSTLAGVYLEEKCVAAVFRDGKETYKLSWDIHEERKLTMPLNTGRIITIKPTHEVARAVLEFIDLTDTEKTALINEQLAKEYFLELLDHWNHKMIRTSALGVSVQSEASIQNVVSQVFAIFDRILQMN